MSLEKEEWLKEATYNLSLLDEFSDMFLLPDGKRLNAFLKKPTLIIRIANKDHPESLKILLEKYEDFKINKKDHCKADDYDLTELTKSYELGLTPEQAAINIIKVADTPEEASEYLVSPSLFKPIFSIGLFIAIITAIVVMSNMLNDRIEWKDTSKSISTIYENDKNVGVKKIWNDPVTIESSNNVLKLTYNLVPAEKCVYLFNSQKKTGWDSITVGDKVFTDYNSVKNVDIANACTSGDKDTVDMVFKQNKE